jgi:hypothetical protein
MRQEMGPGARDMQDTVSSATVAAGLVANPGSLGALTDGNHFGWAKDAR